MWRRNSGVATNERAHDKSGQEEGDVVSNSSVHAPALIQRSTQQRPVLSEVIA